MKISVVAIVSSAVIGVFAISSPAVAKTRAECVKEWQAKKKADSTFKTLEKDFLPGCMKPTAAAPAAPMAAPAKPAAAPAAPMAAPAKPAATKPTAAGKPTGANQFASEMLAKAHCPSATVVWANLNSKKEKVYHFTGHAFYGHTKKGAYMCEKDAMEQGMRAAKNEKHP